MTVIAVILIAAELTKNAGTDTPKIVTNSGSTVVDSP